MDELYRLFLQISGGQSDAGANPMIYALANVIAQAGITPESQEPQVVAKASTQSQSDNSDSVFSKVVKSVFGVAPIIGGLIDLFSGSDDPPPLVKYSLPPSVNFEAAQTADGLTTADYDQSGLPRAYATSGGASSADYGQGGLPPAYPATQPTPTTTAPQITVNVQAMDARSFMDRSGDIALAVRDAMLNLNSINDVVNDL